MIGGMSLTALPLLLALASPPPPAADGNDDRVRIYRCVGSDGQVALQDSPCLGGRQQVIERQRPRDPSPAPASAPAPAEKPAAATAAAATPRMVVVASRPLYECTTAEGERYTADDGEGNPRWVPGPLVPVVVGPVRVVGAGPSRPPGIRPSPPSPPPVHGRPAPGGVASVLVPSGGAWVRDSCQRLSTEEACSLLGEQRWSLISRYNSALASERQELVREQRRVEQRMREQPCAD